VPRRSRRQNGSEDENQAAARIVSESTGQPIPDLSDAEKKKLRSAASTLGRLGGIKGGHARAAKMSAAELKQSARHAAQERWKRWRQQRKIDN
jgi:hypothetical protein